MFRSRRISQIFTVLTLGLFACQVDNTTSPTVDDASFGWDRHGRDGRWNQCDDYGYHDDHDNDGYHDEDDEHDDSGKMHLSGSQGKNDDKDHGKTHRKRRHRDKHCKPKKDRDGTLTIIKHSNAPGTFSFHGTPFLGSFTLETDDAGVAQVTFDDVDTRPDYNIFETPHPDFTFLGATCTLENGEVTGYASDSGVTDVRIQHGKETTCVFENEKVVTAAGALRVIKSSNVPGTFNFEGAPTLGAFSLTTPAGGTAELVFDNLDATVTYSITEILDAGVSMTGACTLEGGAATGTLDGTSVIGIAIEDGMTTTCSFVNEVAVPTVGSLNVVKVANSSAIFTFNGTDPIGTFTLDTGDPATSVQLFSNLDAGITYDLTEVLDPEFTLESATCQLADGTPTGTLSGATVAGIVIEDGLTTTCTFENALIPPQLGSLNIVKTADGAGVFTFNATDPIGTFTLDTGDPATSSQLFEGLDPAVPYDVTEVPDAAFDFVGATCSLEDGTSTGAATADGVTGIVVVAGQTTTCTFANALIQPQSGSLRVVKESDVADIFNFTGSPAIGSFTLATDDPVFAEVTFTDLPIEVTYTITETLNPAFDLTSVTCTLSDGTATGVADAVSITGVQLQAGLTTTCTFVNTFIQPVGFLRVIKDTDNTPGTFNFEGSPDIGAFTLVTPDAATSSVTFEITNVGTLYTITELENAAFDLVSAGCVLESAEPTGTPAGFAVTGIQVVLGQTTTCTFVNASRPVGPPRAGSIRRPN